MFLRKRRLGRGVAVVGAGMTKFGVYPRGVRATDLFVAAFTDMKSSVDKGLIEFLRRQDKANVLLIPVTLLGRRVPYETEHNALVFGGNVRKDMYDFLWLFNPVPYVNPHNLQDIVREFDIHIVLHDAKSSSARNIFYDFSFLSLVFEQDNVEVYTLPGYEIR